MVSLIESFRDVASRAPTALALAGVSPAIGGEAELLAAILAGRMPDGRRGDLVRTLARTHFESDGASLGAALRDVAATSTKDVSPGGPAATLLSANGLQALVGHRVAHGAWAAGRREEAMALKVLFTQAFGCEIHPAVRLGAGIWLDHGIGFVAGSTAAIEDDVSIWHGVTLGSNLKDRGETRHPRLRRGCTICAGALLIGDIDIGEGAVVAAGAVVLKSVAPGVSVAGVPAREVARRETSFKGFEADA